MLCMLEEYINLLTAPADMEMIAENKYCLL